MAGITICFCTFVIEKTGYLADASTAGIEVVIIALICAVLIGCTVNTCNHFIVYIVIELFSVRSDPTVERILVNREVILKGYIGIHEVSACILGIVRIDIVINTVLLLICRILCELMKL